MEEFNNTITVLNILVSCFVSIFYISRKYCRRDKQSKITKEIIQKINELGIGEIDINQIVDEIKKVLPVKIDDEKVNELNLKDVKITVSQEL